MKPGAFPPPAATRRTDYRFYENAWPAEAGWKPALLQNGKGTDGESAPLP